MQKQSALQQVKCRQQQSIGELVYHELALVFQSEIYSRPTARHAQELAQALDEPTRYWIDVQHA